MKVTTKQQGVYSHRTEPVLISKPFPSLLQAKKKPLEVLVAADLGLDLSPQNIVLKVEEPAARKAGIFVESVDALLDKLRNEAAVVK